MILLKLSTRLLPGRSGRSNVCESSTVTKPGASPRGEASGHPSASAVDSTRNGDRAINARACASMWSTSFFWRAPSGHHKGRSARRRFQSETPASLSLLCGFKQRSNSTRRLSIAIRCASHLASPAFGGRPDSTLPRPQRRRLRCHHVTTLGGSWIATPLPDSPLICFVAQAPTRAEVYGFACLA
jgi:hypothetical protein